MGRILVIEDEAQMRKLLRQVLEDAGYEVEEASDSLEGTRLYRENPADLIMPTKEGMETILDLKLEFPDVKIIAISGGGRVGPEPYLQIAEGFGAERVFMKPFDIKELLTAVEEIMG